MPRSSRKTKNTETDSRSSAFGRKRSAAGSVDSSDHQQKRRKGNSAKKEQSRNSTVGTDRLRDFVPFSSLQDTQFAQGRPVMAEQQYGKNRLRAGFVASTRGLRSASHEGTPEDSEDESITNTVPRVNDADTTDDDGGITLNIEASGSEPIIISDDESMDDDDSYQKDNLAQPIDLTSDAEEGEISDDESTIINERNLTAKERLEMAVNGKEPLLASNDHADPPQTCLKDLNADQLEDQIRYAFWHLKREEIDLNRPVRCLQCQSEGHIDQSCPERKCPHCSAIGKHKAVLCPKFQRCAVCRERGHEHCNGMKNTTVPCDLCLQPGHAEVECILKHYPEPQLIKPEHLELWISCSSCASKSHLVGDCPNLALRSAPRWSLKAIDPNKVTNLSLQKGMDRLEKDAQNKNMRPSGLQIRGRANRLNAGTGRDIDSSDDQDMDHFLSHPPTRRDPRPPPVMMGRHSVGRGDAYRPPQERYDRYNAPSDNYRPPRNPFYDTDSFGRARSRSPPRKGGFGDSYRPGGAGRRDLPDRQPASARPGTGVSIQLPNRKGSNPNLAKRGDKGKRGKPAGGRGRGR